MTSKLVMFAATASAVLAGSGAVAKTTAYADFNQFKHGQMLPATSTVDDLELASFPANSIRIYDPATDDGPKGAIGATIKGRLDFRAPAGRFGTVRVRYVSDTPGPTTLTILDRKGATLRTVHFLGSPQNMLRRWSVSGLRSASAVLADNPSGEALISRICFAR